MDFSNGHYLEPYIILDSVNSYFSNNQLIHNIFIHDYMYVFTIMSLFNYAVFSKHIIVIITHNRDCPNILCIHNSNAETITQLLIID